MRAWAPHPWARPSFKDVLSMLSVLPGSPGTDGVTESEPAKEEEEEYRYHYEKLWPTVNLLESDV